MSATEEESILEKLDASIPAPLARFDAFPKLPSTYKARSESRGFLTVFVCLLSFLLVLNDIGEFLWGWPDYEFSVDHDKNSFMNINVDMVVNMPCKFLSVDLRDAVGDRIYLSKGFRRDGTLFDIGQATSLKEHAADLSARQAVKQSRRSRGFFSTLFNWKSDPYRPTYNYKSDGSACRVYGTVEVKKVTANLHITTLGHGYASGQHVDHSQMNLSHVITEFSFGPYFPDITQPLDYSFEVTPDAFVAYQYFVHVVPTTYIAPRSKPLYTHQYSVTHYTRKLEHHRGTPGIFFKFDMEPLSLTIHQRTTTFLQLVIRCVGVVGGVFVCMGYALRIGARTYEVVSGADQSPGIVAAEASGAHRLRSKWGGTDLRSRTKIIRQGSGWTAADGNGSPLPSAALSAPYSPYSPYLSTPSQTPVGSPRPGVGLGFGPPSPFGPPPARTPNTGSFPTAATVGSPYTSSPRPDSLYAGSPRPGSVYGQLPSTPARDSYSIFPPTPNPANGGGFPSTPPPPMGRKVSGGKKDD
ncbi:hypothetical protein PLICRDRAFT_46260 [Plicaturopsis crispa FD-325 SS-3]|uniref:DUF1692-domain-containing protein n=1 Tax=Plicaturopsis crispa FD-325 SS-3 TaxID=944288 RepID=A0A0C9T862_PLICR|nr:hypothetical protein PLICRDRAFT_46260 [Plicaturopsis crispa FD-325 SS-3]